MSFEHGLDPQQGVELLALDVDVAVTQDLEDERGEGFVQRPVFLVVKPRDKGVDDGDGGARCDRLRPLARRRVFRHGIRALEDQAPGLGVCERRTAVRKPD